MLLAGTVAQRRYRPNSVRRIHASGDWHEPIGILLRLFGFDTDLVEVYQKFMWIQATHLFDQDFRWECVEVIAAALIEKRTLTGREASTIIQATLQARCKLPEGLLESLLSQATSSMDAFQ